jgi:hypothetical protein
MVSSIGTGTIAPTQKTGPRPSIETLQERLDALHKQRDLLSSDINASLDAGGDKLAQVQSRIVNTEALLDKLKSGQG